jgi:hypothetical protein
MFGIDDLIPGELYELQEESVMHRIASRELICFEQPPKLIMFICTEYQVKYNRKISKFIIDGEMIGWFHDGQNLIFEKVST